MFGNGYGYVAEDPVEYLPEGDYKAKITAVNDNKKLQNAVNVMFSIEGHPNASPYSMTLFDRPSIGQVKKNGEAVTDEDIKSWDRSMSRFFDAFDIKAGDFNFAKWKGHTGYVTCKKNKNNDYSSLFVAFNQHKEAAPEAVQKVAAAVGGTVTATTAPASAPSSTETYQEDIPF